MATFSWQKCQWCLILKWHTRNHLKFLYSLQSILFAWSLCLRVLFGCYLNFLSWTFFILQQRWKWIPLYRSLFNNPSYFSHSLWLWYEKSLQTLRKENIYNNKTYFLDLFLCDLWDYSSWRYCWTFQIHELDVDGLSNYFPWLLLYAY